MFLISKLAGFLLAPSNLILAAILLGALVQVVARKRAMLKFEAIGRRILIAGIACLALATLTPIGPMLVKSLERAYAPLPLGQLQRQEPAPRFAGIILLGGAVDAMTVDGRIEQTLNDSAERMRYAAVLARAFPDAPIYVSGGRVYPRPGAPSEAEMMASFLTELGVGADRIRQEGASRTTSENAERIAAMTAGGDACYLLVTSAFHMRRSMAAFEAAGVRVRAAPTDWRSDDAQPLLAGRLAGRLGALDLAAHEYLGLAAAGALFGRPDPAAECPA